VAVAVLDASVFIAFLDPDDAHHTAAIVAMRGGDTLVLPASAYAEILVHPHEQGPAAVRHVESLIADLPVEIEPTSVEIARHAAELRAKKRARLRDALVIATGDVLTADVVLTADRRWRRLSRRVRVI
jgi:predicted nucleic acid-binding protein